MEVSYPSTKAKLGQPEKILAGTDYDSRGPFISCPVARLKVQVQICWKRNGLDFVVIIAPARSNERSDLAKAPEEWEMAALYIEPDVRGLGLGKRMVEETIAYIKKHSFSQEGQKAYCLTNVRHGNDNALERYQRLGFHIIDPSERVEKEGREYLATKLRIDIESNQ